MSKTFKSAISERKLTIDKSRDCVRFTIIQSDGTESAGLDTPSGDAAAQALAILEAAGHVDASKGGHITRVSNAMYLLQEHIELEAVNAAAEADRVKLEAEALKFYNAHRAYSGIPPESSWDGYNETIKKSWLAVARAARELNKEDGQ